MREQHNVTFEPNLGPAFPVCAGPGTQGSAYGAAYGAAAAVWQSKGIPYSLARS